MSPHSVYFQHQFSYNVEVDKVSRVKGSSIQGAVVSSELLPSSMEVIGHHIDEIQGPKEERTQEKHGEGLKTQTLGF